MASGSSTKIAIRYKDSTGTIRTKHCGTSESVRECISWLKREGFDFISRGPVENGSARKSGARQIKHRATI